MWGKNYSNEILRATNCHTYYSRSKQLQKVKYFNYLGCLINYARHTHEIKSRMAMAKQHSRIILSSPANRI